ncbi:YfcC family protein [Kocuria rosea]|uniref:YfcC family protein n=1 Tax=Kocuria rosea TaxID=1275 RepID=UPI0025416C3D|nr:AbgT family transporter [Kocuria rosea]WIG17100.1 AbgT family transporter [Kocuria rosea]
MATTATPLDRRPAGDRPRFRMPHVYVVLFVLSGLAALATYLVPASRYERVLGPDDREMIDPSSYGAVESSPTSLVDFVTAIPRGLVDASEVVFFTFVIGGTFMVLRRTGIIEAALDRTSRRFASRRTLLIPVLITAFAVIASLIGTQELALVYIPVILPVMIALGYDSLTAVAVALVGTTAGFTAGVLNPINTGLGQQIAGLEPFSGLGLRLLVLLALVVTGSVYVMRYARRISRSPERGLLHDEPAEAEKRRLYADGHSGEPLVLTRCQGAALLTAAPIVGVLVWGVLTQGWFFLEMAGMFIVLSVVVGLVAGLSVNEVCAAFTEGMRDVLEGAIIVGVARSVAVVLEDGNILDTVVHALGNAVDALPAALAALGMFAVQTLFNFVVPSGSGQAVVTMPIMAPLADLVGVTRQTSVLAYQLGDGPSNILYPTSGYFMAALAIGGVRWEKWVRFFLPLFGIWVVLSALFLVFAQLTQWNG